MRLRPNAITVIGLATVPVRSNLISCWAKNGVEMENQTLCPNSRACCGPEATCLSNGLCHDPNLPSNIHIRGPCEDARFESRKCPRICLAEEIDRFPRVEVCDDGSLCCEYDSQCCEGGRGIFLDNEGQFAQRAPDTTYSWGPSRTEAGFSFTKPPPEKPTSETATDDTTSNAPTTTVDPQTTCPPSNSASPEEASNQDQESLKIGLGVGIPIGCLLFAGAAVWLVWRRRRHKAVNQPSSNSAVNHEIHYAKYYEPNWGPSPAYWQYPPLELESNRGRRFVEMQS